MGAAKKEKNVGTQLPVVLPQRLSRREGTQPVRVFSALLGYFAPMRGLLVLVRPNVERSTPEMEFAPVRVYRNHFFWC